MTERYTTLLLKGRARLLRRKYMAMVERGFHAAHVRRERIAAANGCVVCGTKNHQVYWIRELQCVLCAMCNKKRKEMVA